MKSYWDTQTSGITTSADDMGKTTNDLQSPTTVTGIDDSVILEAVVMGLGNISFDTTPTWQVSQSEDNSLQTTVKNNQVTLTIPADYVEGKDSSAQATLKLKGFFTIEGKQITSSAEIELTINKINNDELTTAEIGTLTLEGATITAPTTLPLNEDEDGVNATPKISYEWQQLISRDEWKTVSSTTMSNSYSVAKDTPDNTKYRVLIGYTDAQGYRSTATSVSITYVDIDRDNNGLIEIETKAELDAMRYQPDGSGYKESAGATKITIGCPTNGCNGYELKAHIDLNPTTNTSVHENWQPIGDFDAIFEGNHYTMSNLKIVMSTDDIGFFSKTTERAKIRNVGLLNIIKINGNNNVGGLIGFNQGKVANSYVIAKTIEGNSMVGGLIGFNSNATITKSYAIVKEIIGEGDIGGLIGKTSGGEISNSYAKVDEIKENGSSVCQSGRLIDKLIGNNEEANSSNIIESEMAGGCQRLDVFNR